MTFLLVIGLALLLMGWIWLAFKVSDMVADFFFIRSEFAGTCVWIMMVFVIPVALAAQFHAKG